MEKTKRIDLPNRYGYEQWLARGDGHAWTYEAASDVPNHCRFGSKHDIEGIAYFDPPGGPMVHVGELADAAGIWRVAGIAGGESGLRIWLGDERVEGDYEAALAAFREIFAQSAQSRSEESPETPEPVETTDNDVEYQTIDFGTPETQTSASFSSFVQSSDFQSGTNYEYPRPLTIGMIGKAGSGKDTVADHLVSTYGFDKMALADPLKAAVQAVFAVDDEHMFVREKREEELEDWPGWTVRKLLQFVGTELFRAQVDEDVWVKNVVLRAKRSRLGVISDVRFPNEVDFPRKMLSEAGHDVYFIKVVREGVDGTPSGIAGHESEAHDLDGDYCIHNDGTIDDLLEQVDGIMTEIQSGA